MSPEVRALLYLVAAAAFIVGLKRLGSPRTARSGNTIAAIGMMLAVLVTLVDAEIGWAVLATGVGLGAAIGVALALRVQMTAMPQLVATFNGFGGIASALVAGAEFVRIDGAPAPTAILVTMVVSVAIGGVTFSGSLVAFAKLQGLVSGSPVTFPLQRPLNLLLALTILASAVWVVTGAEPAVFWAGGGLALLLGILVVLPIGGADMPVVIALLNSFSGLAAAATGFVITNTALIIGGALVGASGLILTTLMTEAMNRPLTNVLFGAFGGGGSGADDPSGDVATTTAEDLAITLAYSPSVVVVPGYGLAVAQAQHALREVAEMLEERGVSVQYGIHPVAGRMPGHMNVLLAEADIPYDRLLDLEQTNALLQRTDVVVVLGANDVVNPSARDDPGSPISGMPILEVDRARAVVVVKRSLSPGFAGIDNPLFYRQGTQMLFGDAKKVLTEVASALEAV